MKERERSLHSRNRLSSQRSGTSPPPPYKANPLRSNILHSTPLETSRVLEVYPDPFKRSLVKETGK